MKIVKKLSFSLIEVGLALLLAAVMVALLLSSFTHSVKVKKQVEHITAAVLERKFMQEKLTQIFSSIHLDSPDFICAENRLVFAANQDVDIDPDFSGLVKTVLFLEQGKFKLLVKSLQADEKIRTETLMEHVSAIDWEFLPQPEPDDFGKMMVKSTWSETEKALPIAVRLTLHLDDATTVPFAFFINRPTFEMPQ
ncbi:MAG: DUF1494 domain-containing protein [Chlamydiia bacterium]|nr:DUF1494 domain-containing protein [Chlamydiia bacterium]HPE85407.1 DUF1494 domain-containing protein [Chlamydiales bacterium]